MKKLLALVLALVMTMSLVTISNAAFKDESDISYKEAVDVMTAVGVLKGYTDGNFGAKDTLTRAQAAKIIAYLDLGEATAEAFIGTGSYFTDVPASHWAAGYIEYCAQAGYVAGVGDKKFAPDEKVTGYQFAKMLLCVLGYNAKYENMNGADWQINTAKLAADNDLFKGIEVKGSVAYNREQAAQMGLNALKATMVDYSGEGVTVKGDGFEVITSTPKSYVVTGTGAKAQAISDKQPAGSTAYTIELGEKLYDGKLELKATAADNDNFGRLAKDWEYKGEKVASSIVDPDFTINAKTSAKDLAKLMKGWKINNVDIENTTTLASTSLNVTGLTLTATSETSAKALADETLNGKTFEFYDTDDDKDIDVVVIITYHVDELDTVEKKNGMTYSVDGLNGTIYTDGTDDTAVLMGDVEDGDIVTAAQTSTGILYVYPTTKVVGAQSQKDDTSITVSGTKYKVALGVYGVTMTQFANSTDSYNYYFDQFGFVVKTTAVDSTKNYAIIDSIKLNDGLGGTSAQAILVFADGSKKTVDIAKIEGIKASKFTPGASDSINLTGTDVTGITLSTTATANTNFKGQIVTYTIKDEAYTLTFDNRTGSTVTAATAKASINTTAGTKAITKGVPAFANSAAAGNNSTVYLVKDKDGDYAVYTGYKAVPTIKVDGTNAVNFTWSKDSDLNVVFVYIDAEHAQTIGDTKDGDLFYTTDNDVTIVGSGEDVYYTIVGILNGEKSTIKTESSTLAAAIAEGVMYELTTDDDGYVTAKATLATTTMNANAKDGVLNTAAGIYAFNDDTKVYVVDDNEIVGNSINSAKAGDTVYVKVIDATETNSDKYTAKIVYIFK